MIEGGVKEDYGRFEKGLIAPISFQNSWDLSFH